jgi:hypothetical protein
MARHKFIIRIESPEKLKVFEELLKVVGFEKAGPREYKETAHNGKTLPLPKTPR